MKRYLLIILSLLSFFVELSKNITLNYHEYQYKQVFGVMDIQDLFFRRQNYGEVEVDNELQSYLSAPTSVKELKYCLLKSFFYYKNIKSILKLAQLHLFGFPQIVNQEIILNEFCSHYHPDNDGEILFNKFLQNLNETTFLVEQNLLISLNYFMLAYNYGHKDAGFFIVYFIQQSLISKQFSKLFYFQGEQEPLNIIQYLVREGIQKESEFMNTFLYERGRRCQEQDKFFEQKTLFQLSLDNFFKDEGHLNFQSVKQNIHSYSKMKFNRIEQIFNIDRKIQNNSEACPSCEQLLSLGLPSAINIIQSIEDRGQRIEPDLNEIVVNWKQNQEILQFLRQQADQGDVVAQIQLAELLYFGNVYYGVQENMAQARHYFQQAALRVHPTALYNLGLMEIHGNKNFTLAVEYFQRSAELGYPEGFAGLAYLYSNGLGVDKDMNIAAQLFEKAALLGSHQSLTNAAVLYLKGEGLIQNTTKAIELFKLSAEKGQTTAQYNLIILYLQGEQMNISCEKLLSYLTSMMTLGKQSKFVRMGIEKYLSKDLFTARLLFSLSLSLGASDQYQNLYELWKSQQEDCIFNDCAMLIALDGAFVQDKVASLLAADRLFYNKIYDLSRHIYINQADNSAYCLYSLSYLLEHGLGIKQNINGAQSIIQMSIERSWNDNYERITLVPAYLQKLNLWFKILVFTVNE